MALSAAGAAFLAVAMGIDVSGLFFDVGGTAQVHSAAFNDASRAMPDASVFVSFIVPSAAKPTLPRTLASLKNMSSTSVAWETMLVFDGAESAKAALTISDELASDKRFHVLTQDTRLGVLGAADNPSFHSTAGLVRNVGMEAARGVESTSVVWPTARCNGHVLRIVAFCCVVLCCVVLCCVVLCCVVVWCGVVWCGVVCQVVC